MSGEAFCGYCRWWDEVDREALDGFCRIRAPQMQGTIAPHGNVQFQTPQQGIWPITLRDDFCGEFQPHG